MGNPSIIFLDEPTTGVDPVSRRQIWNTLAQVRDSGSTLILTSHRSAEVKLCFILTFYQPPPFAFFWKGTGGEREREGKRNGRGRDKGGEGRGRTPSTAFWTYRTLTVSHIYFHQKSTTFLVYFLENIVMHSLYAQMFINALNRPLEHEHSIARLTRIASLGGIVQ